MPVLYLVEQGATLSREGERLFVRKGGETLLSVPAFQVEGVWVFGNVQLTTPAISLLLAHGVETCFFTMEGRLKGRLAPIVSRNVPLRLRQFERYQDEGFRRRLAAPIVAGKLENARRLIMRYARTYPGPKWERWTIALEQRIGLARGLPDLRTLRGIEGSGSAIDFEAFREMVRGELSFEGRSRRPPRDPVNALLSLGYALLTGELIGKIAASGLDPYLGFYHEVRHGRPALALDLAEEFRHAYIDRFVLSLVNRRSFGPEDFEQREEDRAVLLRPDALRRYLAAYEAFMGRPVGGGPQTARGRLDEQVRRLARAIWSGGEYEPFSMEI
ncbi:CRISPR-associated endonuclease Cas1 [Thermoflexus sp.]|uniref:CRISPR-associated endonuclease Cas1 n=1 Tax=Thermoflexus sp. TaxID=1969742 RepID=UPI002ADE199A|nr:CRISPR-associated endonuclease Cas1 [Thermoflexus sp.]